MPTTTCPIGACILTWNAGAHLRECILSVEASLGDRTHYIVVVDNGSTDGCLASIQQLQYVHIIETGSNLGYARGNNIGAQWLIERGARTLLFINPDVRISKATVSALVQALLSDPTIGCVGGPSIYGNGTIRSGCRRRAGWLDKLIVYSPLLKGRRLARGARRRVDLQYGELGPLEEVYAVTGACMALRADAFLAAGGFDENTFLYEEELILTERLAGAGYRTAYARAALYYHEGEHSTRLVPLARLRHFIESEQCLVRKYYGWHPAAATAFRTYRYCELLAYMALWATTTTRERR